MLGDGTDADVIALRRGPARGGRADLLRPRRPDPRPARLGGRPGRGGRHRRAGRATSCSSSTAGATADDDPARGPGARRCRPTSATVEQLLTELRGSKVVDPGAAARRQAGPPGDRRPQRRAGARAPQDQAGQRPHHPQPGAGGDPGGARARRGAAAHRVLRRLQPPGHRGGRLDGGLRGRAGPQERVPPVRDPRRRRAERRRLDARGDHPAVPPAARRAGRGRAESPRAAPRGRRAARPAARRPRDRPPPQVRLRARAGRRRRRPAAGGRRPAGARRARHRRHPGLRAGQAARGGVAARARRTR